MRIVEQLPQGVEEIEHVLVPLPDGTRLAARIWLPEGAARRPVPAVLEYIPYRKRDRTRARDEPMHRYFAGHGLAAIRVDIRGSGDSEGFLDDEYLPQEQQDGIEVLRWIAAQPWCSGRVGMIGKSWGGFAALQIAALQPKELHAVIAVCATDDRYRDDAHYMGGCLLNENLIWGTGLMAVIAKPPDPKLAGADWRDVWRRRLERVPSFPARWLRHPTRDRYWKHGSVGEDYGRIACPVLAVSGWADGYSNAVPRLMSGLNPDSRGVIGPWAHQYPHQGVPGPAIGFLQEALRWWDRWLKDERNGADEQPRLRAWMQEYVSPRPFYARRPGRWVAESSWPSPRIRPRRWFLSGAQLAVDVPSNGEAMVVSTPPSIGVASGVWCGFGFEGEAPSDQQPDDERSVVFDSEVLTNELEILGAPELNVTVSSDRPVAMLAARLCDVAPDGSSLRVSYGLINLAHDGRHEHVVPIEPGTPREVRLVLNHAGHAFAAGHRVRLALSTGYWPIAWPSPMPVTLTVAPGASLDLPERPRDPADDAQDPFADPEAARGPNLTELSDVDERRLTERDPATDEVTCTTTLDLDDAGEPTLTRLDDIDLTIGHGTVERFRIRDNDPLSASGEVEHTSVTRRGAWSTRVRVILRMDSTQDSFLVRGTLAAYENGVPLVTRDFDDVTPRSGA